MVNVSDPSLASACNEVRSPKSEINWALFGYDESGTRIKLSTTGTDGVDGFVKNLDDESVQYGYLIYTQKSSDSRLIFISWAGPGASVRKKAQMRSDKLNIRDVLGNIDIEIHMVDRHDLTEADLMRRISSLGSNYRL